MFVFNGKLHNLQTWKYDISMTSKVKKYLTFLQVKFYFPAQHSLKM